ncbi:DNA mismatch repair endonuclease MutL [Fructilactobacillus carniphilus]|uniref:DNA mismatch repair protein MutL n=1 Tax=Fructilactobacillus carniphilus TaxID=2940297 RepID=A0ABY5C0V9_9LACO|nr:DNA mismatch repair endonuclease MutL [Fructilactobacillus carniphilus]USS91248.1 DNA mismatch repair endonuclease MutL [Fructilactobacillus carniphilus]
MGTIHELPTILADQIAAGEVIERPASVVKELVENAIDAHSTRIDVEVKHGGIDRVRVTDNGDGIAPDQVRLAFRRFATSKIEDQADLFRVNSLGFRGEALPSIASVAQVVMKTSDGVHPGTEMQMKGGTVQTELPAATRRGTTVEVTDLFFNTPKRRDYLKSSSTELGKITEMMNHLALSHPEIAFSLVHEGKELLRTSGRDNLQQVIAGIYSNQSMKKMIAVQAENDQFQLAGYTSLPELTRASRKYLSVIVNGRFVQDSELNRAIIAGYGSKLMVGRYPVAVLKITMDPSQMDVNVHPTKQSVRLLNRDKLGQFIEATIYQTLAQQNLIPEALDNQHFKSGVARHNSVEVALNLTSGSELPETAEATTAFETPAVVAEEVVEAPHEPIIIQDRAELQQSAVQSFQRRYQQERLPDDPLQGTIEKQTVASTAEPVTAPVSEERFPELRFVGQVHGTYLVAESELGLYIVDQHAAQERINYERLRTDVGSVAADQQHLLVPIVLDYPASDALVIKQHLDDFAAIGLELEPFGANSFIVRQHPAWFQTGEEEQTIRELIDWGLAHQKLSVAAYREQAAIMMSCKQAIKANHHLDHKQAQALLDQLHECENPFNCPHGRPVLVNFSPTDLESMFKRIQDPHEAERWEL